MTCLNSHARELECTPASLTPRILTARARNQAGRVAYTFVPKPGREISVTYGELHESALAVAQLLQPHLSSARGRAGRVLLAFPSGLDFPVAFFGCMYAGAIAVPVALPRGFSDKSAEAERLQSVAQDCEPAVLLTVSSQHAHLATLCERLAPRVRVLAIDDLEPGGSEPVAIDANDIAFLQYTSGSTTTPRGVVLSYGNLAVNEAMIAQAFAHTERTRGGGWLPAFHDFGLIGQFLQPLHVGFPLHVMPPLGFVARPMRWLRMISDYRITSSGGPNFAFQHCVDRYCPETAEGLDLSSWNVAFTGAEPIQRKTLDSFAATFAKHGFDARAFLPAYGLAESTLYVTAGAPGAAPRYAELSSEALQRHSSETHSSETNSDVVGSIGSERKVSIVSCGNGPAEQELRIVDPVSGLPLGDGAIGEIWVRGPHVARGYWRAPAPQNDPFCAELDGRRFLRTGDLGFLRDGELYVTGRLKELIIMRGRNHYPLDIESTVSNGHGLLESTRVFAFLANHELQVAAELPRRQPEARDAQRWASARHAVWQRHGLQLSEVHLCQAGSLPRTSSGKPRRAECARRLLHGTLPVVCSLRNFGTRVARA